MISENKPTWEEEFSAWGPTGCLILPSTGSMVLTHLRLNGECIDPARLEEKLAELRINQGDLLNFAGLTAHVPQVKGNEDEAADNEKGARQKENHGDAGRRGARRCHR